MFKVALALPALCALVMSTAQADAPRSVDARDFDIASVKSGMDYNQALAAVASHFKVPASQIKSWKRQNVVTGDMQPATLSYKKDGVSLTVHFEGRVPVDKQHPVVVSQINYEIPWSMENKESMAKAALAKYGKPSNYPADIPFQWCAHPSPNTGIGCSNGPDQAVLNYSNVQISLVDYIWTQKRIDFVDKSHATKPSF